MRRRSAKWGLGGVLVVAAAAFAGDVEIPVDDLTHSLFGGSAPRPRLFPWPDPKGEWSSTEEDPEPWFGMLPPDAIMDIVLRLTAPKDLNDLTVVGVNRALRVRSESAGDVRAVVARLRKQRPGFMDLDLTLEAIGPDGTKTLVRTREPVLPGNRVALHDSAARSVLTDFDVEIAQDSHIPDPILQTLRSGTHVDLEVFPVPGAPDAVVVLDAVVVQDVRKPPIRPAYVTTSDIDRMATTVERVSATVHARRGEPARCEWTGRDGRTMRLSLTLRWEPAPTETGDAVLTWSPLLEHAFSESRHVPLSSLISAHAEASESQPMFGLRGEMYTLPLQERLERIAPSPQAVEEEKPPESAPPAAAPAAGAPPGTPAPAKVPAAKEKPAAKPPGTDVPAEPTLTAGSCGPGLVLFQGPGAAAARDTLVAEIAAENRGVPFELIAWDVPAGADLPADGTAPAGARELTRSSASMRPELNGLFVAAEAQTYLQDWDMEVASKSSVLDPIIGMLLTGTFANVRLRNASEGRPACVDIDLTFVRLDGITTQSVPVPASNLVGGGSSRTPTGTGGGVATSGRSESGGDAATSAWTSYTVEKPMVRETRIATTLPFGADGTAVLRRSATTYLGDGREIVVFVRVK